MQGRLSEYFIATAYKVLSAVEIGKTEKHHQHEFNGISAMKAIFGNEKREFETKFLFIGNEDEIAQDSGKMTWYDARAAHPTRSEFRLYFNVNFISTYATIGDIMILGLRPDQTICVIICDQESSMLGTLLWLFNIDHVGDSFALCNEEATKKIAILPAMQLILTQLGIESGESIDATLLEIMLAKFGEQFPTTKVFSAFARQTISEIISIDDPDTALVSWITHEEKLFRMLERHIVGKKLDEGFVGENRVDNFVAYSLHVQNRRKARAGSALENHLEYLLTQRHIRFSRGEYTEGHSKPDFLFPGIREYRDSTFPASQLTMLGAKTTAKDRWRQILAEADRISPKHLLTLQAGISSHQLDEMEAHQVIPVIPEGIRQSYQATLQAKIMNLADFVKLVSTKQLFFPLF